jgi:hypothetical protein
VIFNTTFLANTHIFNRDLYRNLMIAGGGGRVLFGNNWILVILIA